MNIGQLFQLHEQKNVACTTVYVRNSLERHDVVERSFGSRCKEPMSIARQSYPEFTNRINKSNPLRIKLSSGIKKNTEGTIKFMGGFNTVASMTIALLNDSNITISVALHSVHGKSVYSRKKPLDACFSSVTLDGPHVDFYENIRVAMEVVTSAKELNASVKAEANAIRGQEDGAIGSCEIASDEYCPALATLGNDFLADGINNFHGKIKNLNANTELQGVIAIAIEEYVTEGKVSEDEGSIIEKFLYQEWKQLNLQLKKCRQNLVYYENLKSNGHINNCSEPADHYNVGFDVANAIVSKEADFVLVIFGTCIGIRIAANPSSGVRCALCYEEETIRLTRVHNDSNVLAQGARIISSYKAEELVKLSLNTKTRAEKGHKLRVAKLKQF
uniref:Fructose-bisphosphate aldolase n=1 Tax=Eufriesea mexicana TaxID=516756 RepID=A0A310S8J3_9HYME